MKCELVYWEDIRKACKYPITDNNMVIFMELI